MVDWSLARQIARFAAGGDDRPRLEFSFDEAAERALDQVSAYSGLELSGPAPPVHEVARAEWAETNLESLAELLEPVGGRLDDRLGRAGALAGPLKAAAGATLAAEVGLVMGYMSQRVLGQYELSLLQPEVPPRLLFVTPNLRRAVRDLEVDEESFLQWVVLHEVTHVLQFSGVTWLREHLGALLREYLATVEVRIDRGAAGGLPSLPDPSLIVERFRDGGLAALVQTREQRRIMERIQSAMAVVEGYSEHVMDAVGADVLPAVRRPARGDGATAAQPLGARAPPAAPARPRPEDEAVRGREALLRHGRRRGRGREAEPRLARAHRACRPRPSSARRSPGSAASRRTRSRPRDVSHVTAAPNPV